MSHPVMDPARDAQRVGSSGTKGRGERGSLGLHPVMGSRRSTARGASAVPAWMGLVDDLDGTISRLRAQLASYDPATTMPARERHDLERALDRYATATDTLARHIEGLLRTAAPRPRR